MQDSRAASALNDFLGIYGMLLTATSVTWMMAKPSPTPCKDSLFRAYIAVFMYDAICLKAKDFTVFTLET